jgi:CheY-like chemotaxis protein
MTTQGTILLADDEETFRLSTVELFRQNGYGCDAVEDATQAIERLRQQEYDVLISDIRMPGNEDLAFIRQLPDLAEGIQAILVTGYPSLETALTSHKLAVVTYLVKPVDFDELLRWTAVAVQRARANRVVRSSRQRIEQWRDDLLHLEKAMRTSQVPGRRVGPDEYLDLTMANVLQSLIELKRFADHRLTEHSDGQDEFHPPEEFVEALRETVDVLQKTKGAFKSRELGQLRRRIEQVLDDGEHLTSSTRTGRTG